MKAIKRGISIVLAVCLLSSFAGAFSSHAGNYSTYQISYMSEAEAIAFMGFLMGTNDVGDDVKNTTIFQYMTGQLRNKPSEEQDAMIAFSSMAAQLLNARVSQAHSDISIAGANIITFLENRYGVNAEYEIANSLINKEINSIKDIILEFVAIATETSIEEIKAVCKIYDIVDTVIHFQDKVREYQENVQAVFDSVKFASSVERADMYDQFKLYIFYSDCYLNFGENNISNMIVDVAQSAYSMVHEATAWVEAVKMADFLNILNQYWLNWNTPQRVELLKKWAMFVAYSAKAPEAPVPVDTEYRLVEGVQLSDGTVVSGKTRVYRVKYPLTVQMDPDDLQYEQVEDGIRIKKYIGPAGKYHYTALPTYIQGKPVVEIGKNAFREENLDSIIIPKKVKLIDDYAFYGIPALDRIVILNNSVQIGEGVFDWSLGPANQTIGDTTVYCNYFSTAFNYCLNHEGFSFKSLAWDGEDIWGVATLNKEFHIYTAAELAYVSYLTSVGADFESFKIVLENDINIGSKEFLPIGTSKDTCFKGSFDGQNHTIYALNIKTTNSYNGLFGYVQAKNNYFGNVTITGRLNDDSVYAGALAAYVENTKSSICFENITTNISSSGTYAYSKGGIVGTVFGRAGSTTKVENCLNTGRVYSYAFYGKNSTGGIIGKTEFSASDTLIFNKCSNSGKLFAEGGCQAADCACGGLLGTGDKGNYIINECAIGGSIDGDSGGYFLGGLIGQTAPKSFDIKNCIITAPIVGKQIGVGRPFLGQMIGNLNYTNTSASDLRSIENSYASSVMYDDRVTFNVAPAVFINSSEAETSLTVTLKNVYSDSSKNDASIFVGGQGFLAGLSPAPSDKWINAKVYHPYFLKNWKSIYSDWDLDNVWVYAQSGYPVLRCFPEIEPCASHDYEAMITEATCTKEGYTTYTCRSCKHKYTAEYVDKLGHDYVMSKKAVADCENKGYELYTCSRCGESVTKNETAALGHDYQLSSHRDSTCNTAGIDVYTCSRCSAEDVREVPKLAGTALEAALQKATEKLQKDYFTQDSYDNLHAIYLAHQNDLDTLTQQAAVDEAATALEAAIAALELNDSAQGEQDGMHWQWEKESGLLRISGNGAMPDYTQGTAPWADVLSQTVAIEVGEGVTSIGAYAFYGAAAVEEVSLPESLEKIGIYAFYECSALRELVVPDSVTYIGNRSFYNCTSLTTVQVPASAVYYTYAFYGDEAIETVHITAGTDGQMPTINYAIEISFLTIAGVFGPCRYAKNAVVEIDEGVTTIGKNSFYNCSGVSKVIVHNYQCVIDDSENTFAPNTVLCAQFESTTKEYAQKYGREFVDLNGSSSYYNINSIYSVDLPFGKPSILILKNDKDIYTFESMDGVFLLNGYIRQGAYDIYVKPLYGISALVQKQVDSLELKDNEIQQSAAPPMGDFNLDGMIDFADVSAFLFIYGNNNLSDEEYLVYDITGDNTVDISDLSQMLLENTYGTAESVFS